MKKTLRLLIMLSFLVWPFLSQAAVLKRTYPRLANYFLKWEISNQEAKELAKWDLVIIDMEAQVNSPKQLKEIRQLNPNIILLAYITPQEILKGATELDNAPLRKRLAEKIIPGWWLRDAQGNKVSNWSGTNMLNLTSGAKLNSTGERFNDYLPEFVLNNIKASGLWDGVFYDNTWGDISWLNQGKLDLNNDGQTDSATEANRLWSEGFKKMLIKTRKLVGNKFIIVGNGKVYRAYQPIINGMMFEGFPPPWENDGTWTGAMKSYLSLASLNHQPSISIINVHNKNKKNYQAFRFGLTSTLLGPGFYSFDYDITSHSQLWWYDEYNIKLGPAESQAYNLLKKNSSQLEPGLWRRDFKYASVFVNSTDKDRGYIFSKEEMEKIKGSQDPSFNNGQYINFLRLKPNDGIILLKKKLAITNSAFINGYFFRAFNLKGQQARNGFFSYLSSFPGGDELIIASGSKDQEQTVSLAAQKGKVDLYKDGNRIAELDPFRGLFKGRLSLAAEVNDGYINRVAIGAGPGGGPQVLVFTFNGILRTNFFAYNKKSRGGVNVALGDVDHDGKIEIITGPGRGEEPIIKIFSLAGKLKNSFLAYGKNFTGGVDVAVADLKGNGDLSIITGPGRGGGPQVRVFNYQGQVQASFFAYNKNFHGGIQVATSDLNNDGQSEILVGVKNFY